MQTTENTQEQKGLKRSARSYSRVTSTKVIGKKQYEDEKEGLMIQSIEHTKYSMCLVKGNWLRLESLLTTLCQI